MRSRYQRNNNDRHGIVRKRVRVIILELMGAPVLIAEIPTVAPGSRGKESEEGTSTKFLRCSIGIY